jgi:stage III sporulation protein AG
VERVFATDKSAGQTEGSRDMEEETVIISGDSGEEVVLLTQRYPTFQGALVVCHGADDPQVRLQITQAISVLTGLGADRITVCKGS